MLDIHFHCLPAIDDGPDSWDDAMALCRMAYEEGSTTIIATPHVLRDPWLNEDSLRRQQLVDELNDRLQGRPNVIGGSEVYYSADLVDLWEQSDVLTPLAGGRHLLIEFPSTDVPKSVESVFHELVLLGITPVVAHPERNLHFATSPDRLRNLVERGAKTQITAGTLLGHFGSRALDSAMRFHDLGLVHFIASDAHSIQKRWPCLATARRRVEELWGHEEATQIFDENVRAVVRDVHSPVA
jgi:protein-tyrosine phosphatase